MGVELLAARGGRRLGFASLAVLVLLPATALANNYDISLRGVGRPIAGEAQRDATTATGRYRLMTSELALALAPRPLAPAETLGYDGFEISIASTWADISGRQPYWMGQPGTPVFEISRPEHEVPEVFWIPTAHVRKGLPFSTELGVQGSYLAFSEMFMLGAEFKIALHESYFRWAPALTARAAFGRLFGSGDIDMTTGEIGGMTSLPFGIGGQMQITPYAGYGILFAHINSQVIDETPHRVTDPTTDQRGGTNGSLYNFPTLEWKDNNFGRFFFGLRFIMAFIEVTYELDVGFIKSGPTLTSHTVKLGFDT